MTLAELRNERLKKYLACEEAILINQEYTIGARTYRRADLDTVRKMIANLLDEGAYLDEEPEKPVRSKRVVFVD